jgi:dipeptidyl aminopeptidase/acylaminoacyl peptidase
MFKSPTRAAGRLLALAALGCIAHSAAAVPPPAEAFGEVPKIAAVEISPSGKLVAWGDYSDATPQVEIYDLEQQKTLRALAIDRGLTLRRILWADDETLLFNVSLMTSQPAAPWSRASYEIYRTLAADVSGGPARILLMGDGDRGFRSGSNLMAVRTAKPRTVVMWTYAEGAKDSGWVPTVFEVDTRTGKGKQIAQGTALTADWIADRAGRPVVRGEWDPRHHIYTVLADVNGTWRVIHRQTAQGELALNGIGADGASVTAVGLEQGRRKLLSIPFDGSGAKVLLEDPVRDVQAVTLDAYTRAALGAVLGGPVEETRWLDARADAQQKAVAQAFPGHSALIVSRSENGKRVIVDVAKPAAPSTYYLVDFATGKADIIGEEYPALADIKLGDVRTISYKARDGYDIPAYLTLPPATVAEKLPLVVVPHNGPEARDHAAFDWLAQFLASRGYLVLQPQFRGSTGFGEGHRLAGQRGWGRIMQDDITDGVQAVIARGLADPARACIVGSGYGGYAALAGAAFTPELYRCAVSINGVSDLPGLLKDVADESSPDSDAYQYMLVSVGSPSDRKLAERSPVRAASSVRAQVMLMHGKSDSVVPVSQTERMAKALEKAGKRYGFVTLPGDDHWLLRSETRVRVLTELGMFLENEL